jgi:hypothetical protein
MAAITPRNTNTSTLTFLTNESSQNNTQSCRAPFRDDTLSMLKSNFYHLHKHNIKPLTDSIRKQKLVRGSNNNNAIKYLKSLQMFDQNTPRESGSRDVMYELHQYNKIRPSERRRLLNTVYSDPFLQPYIFNENRVLLSRGPCKFPQKDVESETFTDNTGNYNYNVRKVNIRGQVKLPAELHKLLEHAVHWGAYKANRYRTDARNLTNANRVLRKFKKGHNGIPWSPHNHSGVFLERLSKTLNVGNLPALSERSTDPSFEIWSLIQSHMWTGHRCLISQYRRNFSKGYGKGLPRGGGGGGGGWGGGGGGGRRRRVIIKNNNNNNNNRVDRNRGASGNDYNGGYGYSNRNNGRLNGIGSLSSNSTNGEGNPSSYESVKSGFTRSHSNGRLKQVLKRRRPKK